MRHLRLAIRDAREVTLDPNAPEDLTIIVEKFLTLASDCRPFVFSSPLPDSEFIHETAVLTPTLDLPFPVCAFEVANDENDHFPHLFQVVNSKEEFAVLVAVASQSGDLIFYGVETLAGEKVPAFIDATKSQRGVAGLRAIRGYLARLQTDSVAIETVCQTINTGVGKEKRLHTIREVVHIRKSTVRVERGPNGGKMDYTHRFEVRGHWKRIKGIGKDPHGNYCVKGRSWWNSQVRGDKSKLLIVKQRVVHSEHNPSL